MARRISQPKWCFGLALGDELRNTYVVKKIEPDKTRDQVARRILEFGPATAVELAEQLEITPAGVRRHLESNIAIVTGKQIGRAHV